MGCINSKESAAADADAIIITTRTTTTGGSGDNKNNDRHRLGISPPVWSSSTDNSINIISSSSSSTDDGEGCLHHHHHQQQQQQQDDGTDYHTSPHIAITSNGSIIFVDDILNANNSSSNKNESIASSNNHDGSTGKQNDTIPSPKAVTTPESFTCGNSGGGGGGGGGYDNSTTDQVDDSFSLYKYSPTNSLALLEGGNTNGNEADVDESIITTTPYYLSSSSSSSPGVCNDGSINTSSFINDNSIDNGMIMTPISTCATTPGGMFDDGNDNRGISSTDAIFGSRSKINTSGFSTIVVAGFGSRGKGNDSSGNINGVDEEEIPDDTSSGTCNTRVTASSIISGTWKGTGGINVDIIMSTASQAYDFVNNDECILADIDDSSIGDDDDDDDDKVSNDTNYESDGSNNDSVNAPRQLLF